MNTWDISSRTITDEGGRTQVHTHIFQVGDDKLVFTERNVFDFGVVINPAYQVAEDVEAGGIALEIDGVLQWHTFGKDNAALDCRPLTETKRSAMRSLQNTANTPDGIQECKTNSPWRQTLPGIYLLLR